MAKKPESLLKEAINISKNHEVAKSRLDSFFATKKFKAEFRRYLLRNTTLEETLGLLIFFVEYMRKKEEEKKEAARKEEKKECERKKLEKKELSKEEKEALLMLDFYDL